MYKEDMNYGRDRSLPPRERGLKWITFQTVDTIGAVAPSAGAWIEICNR